ncbi:hypothetical protein SAMN05216298_0416 [Glycomyces sambucus]|uniref:NB-ARC domain-containing protein n=2 Tax=Glycomyces sambucus TaxID=380244 RepID=A0A1G9CM74_9ACTN|nr:hypothetical protein SAMN05216298_0416 [Glycomyces sambucus]
MSNAPQPPRSSLDGGRIAARGFQYQYLRTLEVLVERIDDHRVSSIRVEGGWKSTGRECVDFDVVDHAGGCILAVQVKSSTPGATMRAPDAFGILCELVRQQESEAYELMTNAVPAANARELAETLEAGLTPAELRGALEDILANAESRLTVLRGLKNDELIRLGRARLNFDQRQSEEIREDLREKLRWLRNRHREGLGDRSAGLLTGYLVSEVLRRAADGQSARWLITEFQEDLLVPGEDLARLCMGRDWGIIAGAVPAIPDVDRPHLQAEVHRYLAASAGESVQRVALVGPSGIGKSSLAAAYIADQADRYDLVLWLDAESDGSLSASLYSVLEAISGASLPPNIDGNPLVLRDFLTAQLSSLAGRWAMVCDNAEDPGSLSTWLPSVGRGDVIITSLNAAANYGRTRVIEVGTLSEAEGEQLLRNRLPESWRNADPEDLRALREISEGWPLAIELIAGYIATCGIDPAGVSEYVVALRRRALDDHGALPSGYPRTLTAAINMCLDPFIRRWQQDPDSPNAALPIAMLTATAYLGSRRIPTQMVAASFFHDYEHTSRVPPGEGASYIDAPAFALGETIRELRRFSLVAFDEPFPPEQGRDAAVYVQTMQVNSIVQDLLRAEAERLPDPYALLMLLATHANRWLMAAAHRSEWQRVRLLLSHARTLFNHVVATQVIEPVTLQFVTNIGLMESRKGNFEAAEAIWRNVIEILGDDPDLNHQTIWAHALGNLAELRLTRPDRSTATDRELTRWLEMVLLFAQAQAITAPEVIAQVVAPVIGAMRINIADKEIDASRLLGPLMVAYEDLALRLPDVPVTRAGKRIRALDSSFSNSDFDAEEGIRTCREVLEGGDFGGLNELTVRRLLIELLIKQEHWAAARLELVAFKETAETSTLHVEESIRLLLNVGHQCAMRLFTGIFKHRAEAAALLHEAMTWSVTELVIPQANPREQHRLRLVGAISLLLQGHSAAAEQLLMEIELDDLGIDELPSIGGGWRTMWRYTRLELYRHAWNAHAYEGGAAM